MIAILALPFYIILHAFIVCLLLRWLKCFFSTFENILPKVVVIAAYYIMCLSMYIAAIFPQGIHEKFFRVMGYYWFGLTLYLILVLLVLLIFYLIIKRTHLRNNTKFWNKKTFKIIGALSILVIIIIFVYGHYNATIIRHTEYDVTIDKKSSLDELNIVLVADLHLGYNIGTKMMEQMVEKINSCSPDVVLVAGDIFDNCFDNISEPEKIEEILSGIHSKYGIYAVLGNHDVEETIVSGFTFKSNEKKMASDKMYELIEKSNMKILCDEYILIENSIYIFGRPDEERPGKYVEGNRLTPKEIINKMDISKPIIVLEHEPKFLSEIADSKVDLHLAGHTHAGQMFPLNISNDIIWKNGYGILQIDNMTSIVTSGVGIYGPYIRVGTIPEVCNIKVKFRQ